MSSQTIQDLLQKFTIFKDLTSAEMSPIIELAQSRTYKKGTHIFFQDDPLTNVYFIDQGAVKIYKNDLHGKEQIVNILNPGQMFPHQGFFRQDNCPANAEVAADAKLIYIPIHLFEKFLYNNPGTSVKLFKVLGDLIVDLQKRLEEQILHNTFDQIVMLLLRLLNTHGSKLDQESITLHTHFTNQELANMIGSSRETVGRTLSQLKKLEIVTTNAKGDLVVNKKRLEELV